MSEEEERGFLDERLHRLVELHQHLDVDRKAGAAVVGGRVQGQPGQGVEAFQNIPEEQGRVDWDEGYFNTLERFLRYSK